MPADLLLSRLLDGADLLDVRGPDGAHYLLLSVEPWLLTELAAHGAATEDDEDGADLEPEETDLDSDDEDEDDDADHEPNVTGAGEISYYGSDDLRLAGVLQWRERTVR